MPPFHDESADALAQEVDQIFGFRTQARIEITPELSDAQAKACGYQQAKEIAAHYRKRNALLTDEGEAAVQAEEKARRTLVEAYKVFSVSQKG